MKDFFISYNKADKDWAVWIAWHLEENGYKVVIQAWDFPPGSNFVLEMDKASKETERTIAVLSPNYLTALYTQSEWAAAFVEDPKGEKRKLLPVRVRECKPDGLLGPIVYIDLFKLDEEAARGELLAGVDPEIRLKPLDPPIFPGPKDHSVSRPKRFPGKIGRLVNVPEPPPNFLPRDKELRRIKERVLSEGKKTTGITSVSRKVGVQGMGGIGKSVLAAAVAQDEEVRQAFPDGIFWLSIGRDIRERDLLQIQSKLARRLGDGSVFDSWNEGKDKLRELLADKACLLILDDVWEARYASAFDSLGPNCRMLITTRKSSIITDLGGVEYPLGLLKVDKALKLLADWAGYDAGSLPNEADEIVLECGKLPLALAMTGAMLRGKPNRWKNVLHKLQKADLDKIERDFPHYPYHDLLKAIQVSVDDLKPDLQARYFDFAVFPEETLIPEPVLQTFWMPEGLDEYDSQDVADLLVDRSLARRDDEGRLSLHDLQFDYVRKQAGDLPDLHNRLLEAYCRKCPDGWHTGPNDGYFFQHLAHHLIEAERKNELRDILFDPHWRQAKLECTDLPALISDYDFLPEDTDSRLIRDALQLSAHVISHDETQLACQLMGRLMAQPSTQVQTMLDEIGRCNTEPWFRPLAPTLTPPGGPLQKTLEGHSDGVNAVAVTPDGRRAVSASSDRTLKVWDLETGEVQKILEGHFGGVNAVAVTADGCQAVSASYDRTLKVWDLETGKVQKTLEGHSGPVWAVAVTPDGRRAVSASSDQTLKVWDLETGEVQKTLEGHSDWVWAVAVTPDGHMAVSASDDRTLKVWDLETGEVQKTLEGHSDWVWAVAVTPDGRCAVSASSDQTLKVWDLETGEIQKTLEGHSDWVWAVAVTPDGRMVVSASYDRTLKVWDLETGEVQKTLECHSGPVWAVAVTPDGCRAVSASSDRTLKVWDLETGEVQKTLEGHSGPVRAVVVTVDGRHAVSASSDRTLKVWDLETGKVQKTLKGHSGGVWAVAATPDCRRAVSASYDRTLKVWDLETGKVQKTLEGHSDSVWAVAATPDGRRAISASSDRALKVWDLETGNIVATFFGDGWLYCCAIAPDGVTIVAGEASGRVHFLRMENA